VKPIIKEDLILFSNKKSGMSIIELIQLCRLVRQIKPKRILEIGTKYGRTTINMAKFSPSDAKLVSVDIKVLDKPELVNLPEYSKIKFLQGDTRIFDFVGHGLIGFDLILVDANHKESFVINDTKIAYRLINPGGIIIWHDYNKDSQYHNIEVTQALNKMNIKPNVIKNTSLAWLRVE